MKKSMVAISFAVVLMMSLVACKSGSIHDHHKEIYKRYSNLESFYSEVRITVKTEKTSSTYLGRQFFEKPDKVSFVIDSPEEIAGSGYTSKDGKYRLVSGFGEEKTVDIVFPKEKSTVFLSDFFERYYKSEETSIKTSGGFDKTTLSCYIENGSEKRFMQSLEIDNDTYLPLKLTTFDIDKNPVVVVEFGTFKRNPQLDKGIFD